MATRAEVVRASPSAPEPAGGCRQAPSRRSPTPALSAHAWPQEDGPASLASAAAPPAAAAPPPAQGPDLDLQLAGWVPADAVHALLGEVGNFRARAAGIEALRAAALDARVPHAALLAGLPPFFALLLRLVADANFKIATSAMTILEELAEARLSGEEAAPHLPQLAAALAARLGDDSQVVRGGAAHALAALARVTGPTPLLAALAPALSHPAWRVREGAVNAHTAALLAHPQAKLDYLSLVRALAGAAADATPRVATAALEAFALLHQRLGALLQGMLTAATAPEDVRAAVGGRTRATPQLGLPTLGAQGQVVHQAHARPPSAQQQRSPVTAPSAAPVAASSSLPAPVALQVLGTSALPVGAPLAAPMALAAPPPLPPPPPASSAALRVDGWAAARADGWGEPPPSLVASPAAAMPAFVPAPAAAGEPGAWGCSSGVPPAIAEADDAEGEQQVEHSAGSLLNWSRPAGRRPGLQPSSSAVDGRGAAAAASPAVPAAAAAPEQSPSKGSGLKSFVRSVRSMPAPLQRAGKPAAAPAPPPATVPAPRPLAAAAAGGGGNAGLGSIVRNWQRQQDGSDARDEEPAAAAGGLAVEPRADSLLSWTRPPRRTPSNAQAAAGLRQLVAPAAPAVHALSSGAATAPWAAAKLSSAKRSLSGLAKRLTGGEAPADAESADSPCGADCPIWSIAAMRAPPPLAPRRLGSRPELSVLVPPPPEDVGPLGVESPTRLPDSPAKAASLSRLRQLSAQWRVWSAPLRIESGLPDSLGGDGGGAALPLSPGAEGGAEPGLPFGSPGPRPGLQALKARARTARLPSGCSSDAQQYSMQAVEDTFGPDRPALPKSPSKSRMAAPAGLGSPTKPLHSLAPAGSGGLNSPTASLRSPSGLLASQGGSLIDASYLGRLGGSAAGVPGTPGGGGAVAFAPSSEVRPLARPEQALQQAVAAFQEAAASQKKELDWQAQVKALEAVRSLAKHHADVLAPALHAVVLATAPALDALRSSVSRLAIAAFQEIAESVGPLLDKAELDAFVLPLLRRAGASSVAGRDNFLAVEADAALAALVAHASAALAAPALLAALSSKSPDVRAKAAMHLDSCLQQHGARLVPAPGSAATLVPRLLRAAVALLDEGGLEARTAGKRMLWMLRAQLDSSAAGGDDFKRSLAKLDCKTDKVWDVLEAGSMPLAPVRLPSAGLRSGPLSPTTSGGCSPTRPSILNASAAAARTDSGGGSGANSPLSPGGRLPSRAASGPSSGLPSTSAGAAPKAGSRAQVPKSLGGIPEGGAAGAASAAGGDGRPARRPVRPHSGGPLIAPSLAGLDLDAQQALDAAGAQLDSSQWKERLAGVEALQAAAAGGQAAALPAGAQMWLADALARRVADANLKALATLHAVLASTGDALAPAAPALLPAVCKCLESGNPPVRQTAGEALECVLGAWPAAAHLPPLMATLGAPSGGARGKALLLGVLSRLAPSLWQDDPALLKRHALPALFALLAAERRPELRQAVKGSLEALAACMPAGQLAAAAQAAGLAAAQMEVVAAAAAAASMR